MALGPDRAEAVAADREPGDRQHDQERQRELGRRVGARDEPDDGDRAPPSRAAGAAGRADGGRRRGRARGRGRRRPHENETGRAPRRRRAKARSAAGRLRQLWRRRPSIDRRKDEKKIWMPTTISVAAKTASCSSASSPSPRSIQRMTITAANTRPTKRDRAAHEQAVLEPEAVARALEPGLALLHEVDAVRMRAQPERDDLCPDDREQRAEDHRVQLPGPAEDVDVPEHGQHHQEARAVRATPPGMTNRCVGLCTSRKRRCRHPSRKRESFDSPARGWYSIGMLA